MYVIEDLSGGNFDYIDVSSLSLPNLKTARKKPFANCANLVMLNLSGLTECNGGLVENCPNLVEVVAGNLKIVSNGMMFDGEESISHLYFPSLTDCGMDSFTNLTSLKTVEFSSCTSVSDH